MVFSLIYTCNYINYALDNEPSVDINGVLQPQRWMLMPSNLLLSKYLTHIHNYTCTRLQVDIPVVYHQRHDETSLYL